MSTEDDRRAFESALSRGWKPVFEDTGTGDWTERWFLDGRIAAVANRPDGMMLTAGPRFGDDAHHAVLWTREAFSGDLKIEFDYTRTDFALSCVTIIYIQATGMGTAPYIKDISHWNALREVPSMAVYHDFMNTYHISFAAFTGPHNPGKDYVRARRYLPHGTDVAPGMGRGLDSTDLTPDYFDTGLFAPGQRHHFCIVKHERELFMQVSTDEQIQYFHWTNTRTPGIESGRIGLRHMFTRSAIYRDVAVSVPVP